MDSDMKTIGSYDKFTNKENEEEKPQDRFEKIRKQKIPILAVLASLVMLIVLPCVFLIETASSTSSLVLETNSSLFPKTTSSLVPEATSSLAPETTSSLAPETTSSLVPEAVSVGQSIYLPDTDIYNPNLNGIHIFKPFHLSCYKFEDKYETIDNRAYFSNLHSFYNRVAKDSGLSATFTGSFSMGSTVNIKSNAISAGYVDTSGTSIEVAIYVKSSYLNEDCFKDANTNLTDEFMQAYDTLPDVIDKPWLRESWQHYGTFLNTFGSHFIVTALHGASVRQWTFAKSTLQYSDKQLKVKACFDFSGLSIEFKACSGVTKEEAEKYKNAHASSHLEIKGATDETRNKFRTERTKELLEKVLNEGRTMASPIDYKYKPIWDILMARFYNDKKRYAKAMNLMQFYLGYNDFGCTLQESGGRKLRYFDYYTRDTTLPIYQCILLAKGCHSDSDCNLGGAGTVTYCYGSSCYEYKEPLFGSKAKSVVARTSSRGGYNDGINNSCHYKAPFMARCAYNYYNPEIIWHGATASSSSRKR